MIDIDKYNNFDPDNLFCNRYPVEHDLFLDLDQEMFPDTEAGDTAWTKENQLREASEAWEAAGGAIFAFHPDLLVMLRSSDAMDLPINEIGIPYSTIYCHLGDAGISREIGGYRIDGFFIQTVRSEKAVLSEYATYEQQFSYAKLRWANCLAIIKNPEVLPSDYRDIYLTMAQKDYQKGFDEILTEAEMLGKRYRELLTDPDAYYADHDNYKHNYDGVESGRSSHLELQITFTFARRDGVVKPLREDEFASYPYQSFYFDFKTHRSTVKDSMDGDMTYLLCAEDADESINLAFNVLCYLNWKDRDEIKAYPNEKIQRKINHSKNEKDRLRAISKANSQGIRVINFCGYLSLQKEPSFTGERKGVHWRRGHWRNQPFGKKRTSSRLMWIKPVIVNNGAAIGPKKPLYLVKG